MKLDELRAKLRTAPDPTSSKLERSSPTPKTSTTKKRFCIECEATQAATQGKELYCQPCALREVARRLGIIDEDEV